MYFWCNYSPVMSSSSFIWSTLWIIMKQCRGSMECQSNAVALLWFTQTHLNVTVNRKQKQKPGCRDGFLGKALAILNLRNRVEPVNPALLCQVRGDLSVLVSQLVWSSQQKTAKALCQQAEVHWCLTHTFDAHILTLTHTNMSVQTQILEILLTIFDRSYIFSSI